MFKKGQVVQWPQRLTQPGEGAALSTGSRSGYDEVSGWLEDYIRPKLNKSRREFLWSYLCLFDKWSRFHVDAKDIDDQESLAYLMVRAEDALRDIASEKPARLWLSVIRSLPLPVIAHIAMRMDIQQCVDLVKIASEASCLFGDPQPEMCDGHNALAVTPKWLKRFKKSLPIDVPRFLGAAHTWYYARGWYRIAGKGGRLAPPKPIDLTAARKSLNMLPPNAIMLLPSVDFTNSDEIMPQIAEYNRRSVEAGSSSITGFVSADRDTSTQQSDPLSWWRAGIQEGTPPTVLKTQIYYPLQNLTMTTSSYFPVPDELSPHLARLAPFAALMPARLGIGFESFGLCCRAVAATLRFQTGFQELRPLPEKANTLHFRAEHNTLHSETLSAWFLFSVMHRGLLRMSKKAWIETLSALVSEGGAKNPAQEVNTFVSRFTRVHQLDTDLEPGLFLQVDQETLALDLLSMAEFFDFCLRKLTTVDDAAEPNKRRGACFEQSVWALLSRHLPVRLAVPLNTRLRAGTVQGEIDIAFWVDGVLVVLECKSWQKTLGYFRGDHASVERRHWQLRQIIEEKTARNVALLLDHLGSDSRYDVLAFVCVAGTEFIKRDYPNLWFGNTPRVLTPQELIAVISDAPRWREVVQSARSNSNGAGCGASS